MSLTTNRTERLHPGAAFNDGALVVKSAAVHQQRWRVAFEGVDTVEAAERLRGLLLFAPPIDDPDALWVHDLIGAAVLSVDGTSRGTVESVQANPASDLLGLDSGALVPLRFVVERRDGELVVDVPDGLFED